MEKSFLYYLGLLTQLGIVIFASIFMSLLVGTFLDKRLGSKGVITVFCLIFGIIGGFKAAYELIKYEGKR